MVTPMKQDFSIHYRVLDKLLDWQLEQGTDVIVVAGTTGEGSTLELEEYKELIRFVSQKVCHRIPVIAGAGSNSTAHAAELSKEAEKAGADALLHVTPYYNKTSQLGLIKHFEACAAATDLPIILYNIPSRTGVNIKPETYEALLEHETIVAVKEASGKFSQIARIAALYGDRLDIYSGNDDQITPTLALGAKGVISVLSNLLPDVVHEICQSYFENDPTKSRKLQLQYLELADAMFYDINPIPVKRAMVAMGLDVGACRLPLCGMEPAAERNLLKVLGKYGLRGQRIKKLA